MIDRNEKTPSLEEMTNAAIERLNKIKWFLLSGGRKSNRLGWT